MKQRAKYLMLTAVCIALTASSISVLAQSEKTKITFTESQSQVVLYTIYRGPYPQMGEQIGKLFAIAGRKGIQPIGNVTCIYLNNPTITEPAHLLTEIRIPVSKEALSHAETLGEMTDVKKVESQTLATLKKQPQQFDYARLFAQLYEGASRQGYRPYDCPGEIFSSAGGDSTLILPVTQIQP